MVKLAICVPHANINISALFAEMLFYVGVIQEYKKRFLNIYNKPVAQARNLLVHQALKDKEVSHIFFIDDDILLQDVNDIQKLIEADKDIIVAWCPIRAPFIKPAIFPSDIKPWQGVVKLDEAGTGCMLIKRKVFEKIAGEMPLDEVEYFRWAGSTLNPLSEDIYFCRKAKVYGSEIYCHTDVVTKHIGPGFYTETGFKSILERKNGN
jgi:glycosyltransferase involved in cell wall biosynthesis